MIRKMFLFLVVVAFLGVPPVFAHCDTMDGPVIEAARKALEAGKVDGVLIWVKADDEAAIKAAFEKAVAVRKLSPQAKELADMYFFETLVRIHREGEEEPYEGVKPAGSPVAPGIRAADEAVEKGSVDELAKHFSEMVSKGMKTRFEDVVETKKHMGESVEAGREFVEAYVPFIHYVEKLEELFSCGCSHGGGHMEDGMMEKPHEMKHAH